MSTNKHFKTKKTLLSNCQSHLLHSYTYQFNGQSQEFIVTQTQPHYLRVNDEISHQIHKYKKKNSN